MTARDRPRERAFDRLVGLGDHSGCVIDPKKEEFVKESILRSV